MNKNVFRLYGKIDRDLKENPETFNTGLIGEALIVASYKQMTIDQLEKLRYIINRIVQKKKGYQKANEAKDEDTDIDRCDIGRSEPDSSLLSADDRPKGADN